MRRDTTRKVTVILNEGQSLDFTLYSFNKGLSCHNHILIAHSNWGGGGGGGSDFRLYLFSRTDSIKPSLLFINIVVLLFLKKLKNPFFSDYLEFATAVVVSEWIW